MANEENKQAEEMEEEQPSGGGKGKLIIIAVLALLVIGGGGAYFGGFLGSKSPEENAETTEEKSNNDESDASADNSENTGEGAASGPFFYDLKEFVVNLNVGSQSPSFLKMTVTLELRSELDIPKLENYLPRIRDSFHIYIRELRKSDLRGSEGIYRLREELLLRVNKISHPIKVKDVLFKEILIQ